MIGPPQRSENSAPRAQGLDVPILLYHSVSATTTDAYRDFAVDPGTFARQMDLLVETGRTVLTVSDFVARRRTQMLPPRPVVLTFDDGFRDFVTGALPVLAERELPATLYAVSGYVGGRSRWLASVGEGSRELLNWRELRECAAYRIEIGAHSLTHPQLDTIGAADAWNEVALSKRILEERLESAVSTFAYPYGYHCRRVRSAVVAAGYESACAVKNALSSLSDDRFSLARITITSDLSLETFARLLDGQGLARAWRGERLKTRAWRVVRRSRKRLSAQRDATDRAA